MTWLLKLIPGGSTLWMLAGAAFVTVALWGGIQTKRLGWAQAEIQEVKNACALERANATAAALKQSELNASITQARVNEQKRVADEAERKLTQARADKAIADAAADKLRDRIAAYVAAAREAAANPTAVGTSPATDDPIGVLADVLGRADARAGLLADLADKRGAAGSACEQQYDSLEVKATP